MSAWMTGYQSTHRPKWALEELVKVAKRFGYTVTESGKEEVK